MWIMGSGLIFMFFLNAGPSIFLRTYLSKNRNETRPHFHSWFKLNTKRLAFFLDELHVVGNVAGNSL